MDLGLTDRRVLVTGGSKGIGLACAHTFAAEGCHLHLAARNAAAMEQARAAIGAKINAEFAQSVPYWPLGQYFVDTAYRKDLTDIRRGMCLPLNVRRVS